jgi:hypothetical protein
MPMPISGAVDSAGRITKPLERASFSRRICSSVARIDARSVSTSARAVSQRRRAASKASGSDATLDVVVTGGASVCAREADVHA